MCKKTSPSLSTLCAFVVTAGWKGPGGEQTRSVCRVPRGGALALCTDLCDPPVVRMVTQDIHLGLEDVMIQERCGSLRSQGFSHLHTQKHEQFELQELMFIPINCYTQILGHQGWKVVWKLE